MESVTAIVPTFRRPALLARALASISAQRVRPAEVIVVTADPVDLRTTQAVVARAHLHDARAEANHRSRGVSGARNSGAELAKGSLLAFLDDDDEWLPDFVGQAVARCLEGRLDLICTDAVKRNEGGSDHPGKRAPDRLLPEAFLTRNGGLNGSNFVIRRSRFQQIGGFDESLPTLEDMDLGLRLSLLGGVRYEALHDRLVRRHIHQGPHLCTPRTPAMGEGVRRFYELHSHRMTSTQRLAFRARMLRQWEIDAYDEAASESGP